MSHESYHASESGSIAGLVDGSITLRQDIGGGLSLTLGPTGPPALRDSTVIEIALTVEAKLQLSRMLLTGCGEALDLPCRLGVRTPWF